MRNHAIKPIYMFFSSVKAALFLMTAVVLAYGGVSYATPAARLVDRAQRRDVAAMRSLGIHMFKGDYTGIPTDRKTGLQWLKMAAEHNDETALLFLGDIYANGYHVSKDKERAEVYYRQALNHGSKKVADRLAKLGTAPPATKNKKEVSAPKVSPQNATPPLDRLDIADVTFARGTAILDVVAFLNSEACRHGIPCYISYYPESSIGGDACVERELHFRNCSARALLETTCPAAGCSLEINGNRVAIHQIKDMRAPAPQLSHDDHREMLSLAIGNGDASKVRELLEPPANLSYTNEDGFSPLMQAVQVNQEDIVKLLISKGAIVNFVNDNGVSALLLAVRTNQVNMVRVLVELGADVNMRYAHRGTALMHAVNNESVQIAKILIEAGANVNAADDSDVTPRILAELSGNPAMVKLVVGAGADK